MENMENGFSSEKLKYSIQQNIFLIIVFLLSLMILIVGPMVNNISGKWFFEGYTASDWTMYIVTKILVSILNMFIFVSLTNQGHLNVKQHPKYLAAMEILAMHKPIKYKPLSPAQWKAKVYSTKGVSMTITTILALMVFVPVLQNWDFGTFLSYVFSITIAISFGLMQMKKAEEYYTEMFYDYAVMIKNKQESAKAEERTN